MHFGQQNPQICAFRIFVERGSELSNSLRIELSVGVHARQSPAREPYFRWLTAISLPEE
jgi:hypothetical protein